MVDRERLSRMTLAVSAAASSLEAGPHGGSGTALVGGYNQLREEVGSALPADRAEDFEARFPALTPPDDDQDAQAASDVAQRLREMATWLEEVMAT